MSECLALGLGLLDAMKHEQEILLHLLIDASRDIIQAESLLYLP